MTKKVASRSQSVDLLGAFGERVSGFSDCSVHIADLGEVGDVTSS